MSDQWWYRVGGEEFGPVPFAGVVDLVHQELIAPDDEVRHGGAGNKWWPVAAIEGLSPANADADPEEQDTGQSAASAAAELLAAVTSRRSSKKTGDESPRELQIESSAVAVRPPTLFSRGVRAAAAFTHRQLRRLDPRLTAAAVLLALSGAAYALVPPQPPSPMDMYDTFDGIRSEFLQKREQKATAEEWNEFSSRVSAQAAPILKSLETQATSKNRICQNLMWAGRDDLPRMLRDAREKPSDSEEQFAYHMDAAQSLLHGGEVYIADWGEVGIGREKNFGQSFWQRDQNHDGSLTIEEFTDVVHERWSAFAKIRFPQYDSNADGFLTQSELRASFADQTARPSFRTVNWYLVAILVADATIILVLGGLWAKSKWANRVIARAVPAE